MPRKATPTDVAPATLSTWDTVSLTTPLGIDTGLVSGVVLRVINPTGSEHNFGARKMGSTDTHTRVIEDGGWTDFPVGIDANDELQIWCDSADVEFWLHVYFYGIEAIFLTNAIVHNLTTADAWTALSHATDTGGNTGLCGFYHVSQPGSGASGSNHFFGLRPGGSSQNDTEQIYPGDLRGAMMAWDGSETVEYYQGGSDPTLYLVGYMIDNFTLVDPPSEHNEEVTEDAYVTTDLSATIPSGEGFAFFTSVIGAAGADEQNHAIRHPDDTAWDPYYVVTEIQHGVVAIDESTRTVQQKIPNAGQRRFIIWGYAPVSVDAPVAPDYTLASPSAGELVVELSSVFNDPGGDDWLESRLQYKRRAESWGAAVTVVRDDVRPDAADPFRQTGLDKGGLFDTRVSEKDNGSLEYGPWSPEQSLWITVEGGEAEGEPPATPTPRAAFRRRSGAAPYFFGPF